MYIAYSVTFLVLDENRIRFSDMLRSHFFTLAVCLVTQSEANICLPAVVAPSALQHLWAWDGLEVSKIAFSSCFLPSAVKGTTFWSQVTEAAPGAR